MYQKEKLNMRAFGQAVKEAREKKGLAREKLAEMLDLSPRHVQYIETRGQHPSVQKLFEIVTLFHISIDQFFFPETSKSKSTLRRQLDAMIDSMDEKGLLIMTGTAEAIQETKETGE
jgi:transcriptional regulator with XRE-family HTH domain